MTKSTSSVLMAELAKLRDTLERIDTTLGTVQSRLTSIEGRLSETDERRATGRIREPGTRVH